ncbi:hypothetical protein Fcan01_18815 [Folsomia candida]|uniref:Death domain-containing protein n=1 Tax=Folsomia candida TaxID=158441 RepID=A0A226DMG0_FOLCA|nr:hypothetical protein Fcan01_18815 [Folsomia candida]
MSKVNIFLSRKKYGSIIAAIGRNNNIRPSSSSSSRVQTHRLVKLLVQDEIAIRKWRMLHRTLGLNPAHFTTLENAYQNGTMDAETMFLKMLDEWSTVKGDQATVEQLEKILVENELVSVAEKVKSSFGNAIITIAAVATVRSITAPKWPQPEQLDNGEEEATGFAKTKRK